MRALALLLLLAGCAAEVEVPTEPAPNPCADAGLFEPCNDDAGRGSCRDGVCCTGCWAGPTCREPGDLACGAAGSLCEPCDGAEMCIEGACGFPSSPIAPPPLVR